jgi:hypothetical protein
MNYELRIIFNYNFTNPTNLTNPTNHTTYVIKYNSGNKNIHIRSTRCQ